jgi:hypothetical protein
MPLDKSNLLSAYDLCPSLGTKEVIVFKSFRGPRASATHHAIALVQAGSEMRYSRRVRPLFMYVIATRHTVALMKPGLLLFSFWADRYYGYTEDEKLQC